MPRILLHVETVPDQLGYGAPTWFALHGHRFRVDETLDRWNGPDHGYFKVSADDGNIYILRHDLKEDEWEMVLMESRTTGKGMVQD